MCMDHNCWPSLKPMHDNTGWPISLISDMCMFFVRSQQRPHTLQIEPEIWRAQLFKCAPGELSPFLGSKVSLHTELDKLLCFWDRRCCFWQNSINLACISFTCFVMGRTLVSLKRLLVHSAALLVSMSPRRPSTYAFAQCCHLIASMLLNASWLAACISVM